MKIKIKRFLFVWKNKTIALSWWDKENEVKYGLGSHYSRKSILVYGDLNYRSFAKLIKFRKNATI